MECGPCAQYTLALAYSAEGGGRGGDAVSVAALRHAFHVYHQRFSPNTSAALQLFYCLDWCAVLVLFCAHALTSRPPSRATVVPLLPHFRCPRCQRASLEVRGLARPPLPGPVAVVAPPAGASFLSQLRAADVDLDALRETVRMCGMRREFRALAWQLLLGYVPGEVALRAPTLRAYRHKYHTWSAQHFREYNQAASFGADEQSLLHQIAVDVPRTHCRALPWLFTDTRMRESLTRVLYVFATVFPRVGYFQGLNEVRECVVLVVCAADRVRPTPPGAHPAVCVLPERARTPHSGSAGGRA